eukprot:scaffold19660_cov43-Cyclotella_meneghiniana.AAC.3
MDANDERGLDQEGWEGAKGIHGQGTAAGPTIRETLWGRGDGNICERNKTFRLHTNGRGSVRLSSEDWHIGIA